MITAGRRRVDRLEVVPSGRRPGGAVVVEPDGEVVQSGAQDPLAATQECQAGTERRRPAGGLNMRSRNL